MNKAVLRTSSHPYWRLCRAASIRVHLLTDEWLPPVSRRVAMFEMFDAMAYSFKCSIRRPLTHCPKPAWTKISDISYRPRQRPIWINRLPFVFQSLPPHRGHFSGTLSSSFWFILVQLIATHFDSFRLLSGNSPDSGDLPHICWHQATWLGIVGNSNSWTSSNCLPWPTVMKLELLTRVTYSNTMEESNSYTGSKSELVLTSVGVVVTD